MKKVLFFMLSILFLYYPMLLGNSKVLATGIQNETQIRDIIQKAGFSISDIDNSQINSSILSNGKVLALFNGSQYAINLTQDQANSIVSFVQNGGDLYISSRTSFNDILNQLGATASGNDGGSDGFDWPLIQQSATQFSQNPITNNLTSIDGDVGASFTVDGNWQVIGKNSDGTPLLATRTFGKGKVVLWYAQRSYRDPGATGNVHEIDITQGSNHKFYENVFDYFNTTLQKNTVIATNIQNETQIRTIIQNAGFTITDVDNNQIDDSTLSNGKVLALFNGSQYAINLTQDQANSIVSFVQNGGDLYISSRTSFNDILNQLGATASGNDGGSDGFDWPLIQQSATQFSQNPITNNLTSIDGDVGASFTVDENWQVIGKNSDGTTLLATRTFGKGKVVLWYAQRSYRDPGATGNVYETDITQGSNHQFYENLFDYFDTTVVTDVNLKGQKIKKHFHTFYHKITQIHSIQLQKLSILYRKPLMLN